MADAPSRNCPPRSDSTAIPRSLESSPSRSSVQSSTHSRSQTPSSSVPNTPVIPTRSSSPQKKLPHLREPSALLTALAAQERRILELKEELQKAEVDLEKLKKQWATHEATKKRNEFRHSEQLQPFNTGVVRQSTFPEEGSSRASREMNRRRMSTSSGLRSTQRKVFSGSRHTRTLSLLSPNTPNSPPSENKGPAVADVMTTKDFVPPTTIAEQTTTPRNRPNAPSETHKGTDKDMILETGKQLVGDFRQGFWTFFEDIKQATVGEEASSNPQMFRNASTISSKKSSTVSSKITSKRHVAADEKSSAKDGPVGEREIPVDVQENTNGSVQRPTRVDSLPWTKTLGEQASVSQKPPVAASPSGSEEEEDWGNWDTTVSKALTPGRKHAVEAFDPLASPITDKSSPSTSMSSLDVTPRPKKPVRHTKGADGLPWPTLTKLSPGNLTRSASALMDEWEKSLRPAEGDKSGSLSRAPSRSKEKKAD